MKSRRSAAKYRVIQICAFPGRSIFPRLDLESLRPTPDNAEMAAIKKWPVALTIAGSDSGGGAGIQADLKTFAALGVHGTSVITCVTAQNPHGVLAVKGVGVLILRKQLEAVFAELPPAAVKTGMLFSATNIAIIADFFKSLVRKKCPLVIDPVMVATSGATLLAPAAMRGLRNELLPLATLVTPNLAEAAVLARRPIASIEDMRLGAKTIHEEFGCAVLVKGGHLSQAHEAVDIFFDGRTEWLLAAPRVAGIRTHGTGCTYSAAVCAAIALGHDLTGAIEVGKNFISGAIANSYSVGAHFSLNHFARSRADLKPGRRLPARSGR
jgi:hydroxymethylpyrimidine/phosphomethylpyrimidine kinase